VFATDALFFNNVSQRRGAGKIPIHWRQRLLHPVAIASGGFWGALIHKDKNKLQAALNG
jgi:hypothetical protein